MFETRSRCFVLFLFAVFGIFKSCCHDGVTFTNPFRFPPGDPFTALFIGFTTPSELDPDLSMTVGFEGMYDLPNANDKELTYPPIISKRSLGRSNFYKTFENRLERHGFSGNVCLLRSICEAAVHSLDGNGLLADIIHIVLTPSTSKDELEEIYIEAEKYGRTKGHCKKYKKKCSTSLVDLISVLKEPFVRGEKA